MSNNGMGERRASNAVTESTGTSEKFPKSEGQGDLLLPGIPDEITLDQICTKLPWKAFYILSTVSPTWREAVQSHRVYDARVRTLSTETLLVHSHPFEIDFSCGGIYLYSPREKRCYQLPEIPGCNRGIPWECQCISLDGKIYVLGGGTGYGYACVDDNDDQFKQVYKEVYVLDLVEPGRREWKQCASMQEGRLKFGCGVIGGKIYVFGGASHLGPVHGSEVYDPKANTWSPIRPMRILRFGHQVATQGEVLLVYGGEFFDPDCAGVTAKRNIFLDENGVRIRNNSVHDAMFLEAYHPVKNEWKVVELFRNHDSESVFMAEGKFHLITQLGIYVQDINSNSWKDLHSNSFPSIGRPENCKVEPRATVIVNDALYIGVHWESKYSSHTFGSCLLEGKGFGSENFEIVWHEANCEDEDYGELKCEIQL